MEGPCHNGEKNRGDSMPSLEQQREGGIEHESGERRGEEGMMVQSVRYSPTSWSSPLVVVKGLEGEKRE